MAAIPNRSRNAPIPLLVPVNKVSTIAARDNKYLMPKKEAQKLAKQGGFARINIGVDYQGI